MSAKETTFINLFGVPGAGKTLASMEISAHLKRQGHDVYQLQEYAAYLVVAGRTTELTEEQGLVLAKQNHIHRIINGKFDYAVTDSPLLLCPFYAPATYPAPFLPFARALFESYRNVNFFVRSHPVRHWSTTGRRHSKHEAVEAEPKMLSFLAANEVPFVEVPADAEPSAWIIAHLGMGK